jgi:co-chaperonin GroES (HSP10)
MATLNYLIVELDVAYNNEVDISENQSLIVNSTIESVSHISRKARVLEAPDFVILQEGDQVIVHHNIFRLRNDTKGNLTQSNYCLGDNKYFVPLTEVFMYKRDSDWVCLEPYVFIKPIPLRAEETVLSGIKKDHKGMEYQKGLVAFNNKNLIDQGVKVGNEVAFSKNSEYEFDIDGELYYKMNTRDILAVI